MRTDTCSVTCPYPRSAFECNERLACTLYVPLLSFSFFLFTVLFTTLFHFICKTTTLTRPSAHDREQPLANTMNGHSARLCCRCVPFIARKRDIYTLCHNLIFSILITFLSTLPPPPQPRTLPGLFAGASDVAVSPDYGEGSTAYIADTGNHCIRRAFLAENSESSAAMVSVPAAALSRRTLPPPLELALFWRSNLAFVLSLDSITIIRFGLWLVTMCKYIDAV